MPEKKITIGDVQFKLLPESYGTPGILLEGIGIMALFDDAAQMVGRTMEALSLDLEFQLQKTDGTWVHVDPERIRLATRRKK